MKSVFTRNLFLMTGLLLLACAMKVQAAGTTYTTVAGANGLWSATTVWAGGVAASGAGNIGVLGAGGSTFTLDVPTTMGVINDGQGSARAWTINASGTIAMTMDNTGNTVANSAGTLNAYIGESSSGTMTFNPNIIIQNTDLDVANTGSTTPVLTIGVLDTSTITALTAQNLFIRQNQATSTKAININSSIGSSGSVITVQNVGTGGGAATMNLNGAVGPNAGIVQNSANSVLSLNNAANNYTGSTTITLGTLRLGVADAIPSSSSVSVTGTLNLAGFSDTLGGLSGAGTVNGTSGTPTLTVGGGNVGGTFSGLIQNNGATSLSLAKTGSGTEGLSGANTYTGTTTINGGFLNAGVAEGGSSGPFGNGGTLFFGGGSLQYSAANQNDYSGRFSTAANQSIRIDTAGQTVSFGTALTSSGGSLTKVGDGTLTLNNAESYTGNTTVNGGTLALGASASLAGSSTVAIGAGGTFDVSALASPYALGGSAGLKASGTGTTVGTTAANIVGASGGIFDLGSQPISLTWGGGSSGTDNTHPSLLVSQGTLNFNGNIITVVVPGTALGVGVYTLISAPAITGTPNATPAFTGGNGKAPGTAASLSVSHGSVILTVIASGTVGTWTDGSGTDNHWSTAGNWSGGVPHLAQDSAVFGNTVSAVNLDTAETVGALFFNQAASYTISGGNTLTLDNSGGGAAVTVTAGTANAIQTALALNDNMAVTVNSGKSLAISGVVQNASGTRTLTINGAGTTILSGANSYGPAVDSVGTTLSGGGTLQVGNDSALGAGGVSVSGNSTLQAGAAVSLANNISIADATMVDNNGNDFTLNGVISGAGALTKTGNHTLTLSGNNTYTGNTTVNGGVLSISSASILPSSPTIILNGGDLLGNGTFAANNNISVGTNAQIDAASGQTVTLNGVIAAAGIGSADYLTINSSAPTPGTVVLGGTNTFNGTTVIANGTLELDNPLALQNSALNYNHGSLTFGGGITAATLAEVTGTNSTQNLNLFNTGSGAVTLTVGGDNASTLFMGNVADSGLGGSLIKNGSGTWTLSNANYAGNTTVSANGTLTMNGGSSGSSSSTIKIGTAGNASAVAAYLNITGGTVTAGTVNIGTDPNESGSSLNLTGATTANFTTYQVGQSGNYANSIINAPGGTVNLGNATLFKDSNGNGPDPTTPVLGITNGTVIATSVVQGNSTGSGTMNLAGPGSLTIGNSSSSGAFQFGGGTTAARGAFIIMSGGSLTYLGTDGLLMGISGAVNTNSISISGGTATLTGITLNSQNSSSINSSLTLSGTGTLYLGSVGLVVGVGDTAPTPVSMGGTATVGAIADWSSSAPITLASATTNATTIQAADASGLAHNISLSGVLSGTGNLLKTGGGVLTLSGANTYSGTITVTNGTLLVNGTTGGGAITVTNATLGGSGMISGAVTVNGGGHTLPGGYPGNPAGLTTTLGGNLTYNIGAEADFNLNGTYNSGNDQIVVSNGGVTANGVNIGINAGSLDTTGDYVLITTLTGAIAGSFARVPVWLGTQPANAANYSIVTWNNSVVLHFSPISIASSSAMPNPATHGQLVTISANVTSTGYTVTGVSLDASAIGGSPALTLKQNGATGIYTNSVVVNPATTLGVQTLVVTAVDSGNSTNTAPVTLTVVGAGEVWTGNATPNNTWATGANWVSGVNPGPGDFLTFAGIKQLGVNMESSYSIAALTFDVTAGAFTITNAANTLMLTGGVTNNSANVQTLSVPVALVGIQTFNAASNSIVLSAGITGTGGLVVAGANPLMLAGSNSYTGATTVSTNAILQLANTNAVKGSALTLNNGSTLQLRADASTAFTPGSLALQNAPDTLTFDASPLTSATSNTLTLPGTLTSLNTNANTINVTGNNSYTLSLGPIVGTTSGHVPIANMAINALAGGPAVTIASFVSGNWSQWLNLQGGGKITITGDLTNNSNGSSIVYVTGGTTATLQGRSLLSGNASATADAYKYCVANGTLVLDNGYALTNITSGAGIQQSCFILGAATNVFLGAGYNAPAGVLVTNNNSYNAAVYLGDPGSSGGLTLNAKTTNNMADGDVNFTNSGTFTIGGQNTSGTNTYANPIILGWTANRGKSVTLVAATGGQVNFAGNILANGSDTTAGVTVGDTTHGGIVQLVGANTYGGATTVGNGTLLVSGTIANGAVTVANGTLLVSGTTGLGAVNVGNGGMLGGGGTMGGAVTNQSGGSLVPGQGAGAAGTVLKINNGLTMKSGSSTTLAVSHNSQTSDQIACVVIIYGGTLTVTTNAGDAPLVAGDIFQLFKANSPYFYSGSFSAINLPALSPGLVWSNSLAVDGSIEVMVSSVSPAPVAGFSGTPTNLFVTQTVTLIDASTGNITNWVWNFGDGYMVTNSSNASVLHAYAAAGSYTVSLTVSGPGGSNTSTLANYVVVKPKAALGGVTLSGGKLVFSGANGPAGAQYRILTTTNVALPLASWTPVWTNVFAADGSYNYTNTPGVNPAGFFLLVSP